MTSGPIPRPTTGRYFSALLACPQQAWLEYHGDVTQRLPPPPDIRALQQEGIALERQIYETRFADAIRISDGIPTLEQAARTLDAMRSGAPAILQGCLATAAGMGIVDVLECVGASAGSPTGHRYRVGEIKRASALSTGHVFQALWYDELLSRLQGGSTGEVVFFLGDGSRLSIAVADVREAYEHCRSTLFALREAREDPGAHLCRSCRRCPWRGVCMPKVKDSAHLSLLPDLSRRQIEILTRSGILKWTDILAVSESRWRGLGIDPAEAARLSRAAECLRDGLAVVRQPIEADVLRSWTAVAIEFGPPAASGEAGKALAVWHEDGPSIRRIPVEHGGGSEPEAPGLEPLLLHPTLALYGAADGIALRQLASRGDPPMRPSWVNVVDIVEETVHAPLVSLELQAMADSLAPGVIPAVSGPGRVQAIRLVLDWIAGGRGA